MEANQFEALQALAGATSPPLNIAVIGATGVGKSRLINAFFGIDVAKVGTGRPITADIQSFKLPGTNVSIYDTRGLEIEKSTETTEQLERLIVGARAKENIDEHIHIAWLCVSATSRRFEPIYLTMAQMLAATKTPFMIVITKAFGLEAQELAQHVRTITWIRAPIVSVLAGAKKAGGEILAEAFGLDELADQTARLIGDARAAAADYKRYDATRKSLAVAALKRTLDRRSILETTATAIAKGSAISIPVMFTASPLIAKNICYNINISSSEMGVVISEGVLNYMEYIITQIIREAAEFKAKRSIDAIKSGAENIIAGDLAVIEQGLSRTAEALKASLMGHVNLFKNPMSFLKTGIEEFKSDWKEAVATLKDEPNAQLGGTAWDYLNDISMVAMAPVAETQLSGENLISRKSTYWRGIRALLKWSDLNTHIAPELVPILRRVVETNQPGPDE